LIHSITEGLGVLGRFDQDRNVEERGEEVAALLNNLINTKNKGEKP